MSSSGSPVGAGLEFLGAAETGRFSFDDMLSQDEPRLFTTHIRACNLPQSLRLAGRLIVIARNPKDAFVSSYFFSKKLARKAAVASAAASKQDEDEDEAARAEGADTLQDMISACEAWNARVDAPEHGAYGDYYSWYREQAALIAELGPERAMMTFYETLNSDDFDTEIHRLARFLNVVLPPPKLAKLKTRVAFESMAARGGMMTTRRGVVGDYRLYLSEADWRKVDQLFEDQLGDIEALAPLRQHMGMTPTATSAAVAVTASEASR